MPGTPPRLEAPVASRRSRRPPPSPNAAVLRRSPLSLPLVSASG